MTIWGWFIVAVAICVIAAFLVLVGIILGVMLSALGDKKDE